ncbi:glycine cleavage system H protein-like [Amphiura filiformis]|uniref:glycine cleavage system H protein-like n=1 Tax=Amphiura filiformis TaxID=82378 RepID=UPI003B2138CA
MASLSGSRLAVRALGRYRSALIGVKNSANVQPNFQKLLGPGRIGSPQLCTQRLQQIRQFSISAAFLKDRKFTKEHEWISMDDKIGTVGITNYAQDSLGDVVYVSLPEIGKKFFEGDEFGTIESVKAANELFCPVSGDITEVNEELHDHPELVNESCYEKGWLIKLKVKDPKKVEALMTEKQYEDFVKTMA